MKKYKVQLIQTYVFEYEVEAENRALAEVKAKELYKDYKNSNDFFTPCPRKSWGHFCQT